MQAIAASREPIDYLAFGPLFGTTSKDSEYEARGLEALREIAALVAPLPLVAIGGIDRDNAAAVVAAGASGVAVIGAVAGAADPILATRELVAALSGDAP
jgi:thiamine-phosphate pyrophosphorylase